MSADRTDQPTLPEEIIRVEDAASGLAGVIVIHSTKLGPAAGGCRFWSYSSDAAATTDAMRLAEGMSYKNALAGLPFGGGKAVLHRPAGAFDRAALFRAFGRAVTALGGRYVTAEDVGTTTTDMLAVAHETHHVAGLPEKPGAPGGDPSPWTALGVFEAMKVAARRRLGAELSDLTIAVQGLGNVGFALCRHLHAAGARLLVAEPRGDVAALAAVQFGAKVMRSDALIHARADVFAPCALGAVLDAGAVAGLRARIVCGAANNQLATPEQGLALAERDILYAPDYCVNAGGIINVAAEYCGWTRDLVSTRVMAIGERLEEVLDIAEADGIAPHRAADALARTIIAGAASREVRAA